MERRLLALARDLRRQGVAPSVAEVHDGARALLALGVSERGALREGLAATLVKSRRDRPLFDEAFERWFPARPLLPPGAERRPDRDASGPGDGRAPPRPEGEGRRPEPPEEPRDELEGSAEPGERSAVEREAARDPEASRLAQRRRALQAVSAKRFRGRWTPREEALAAEAVDELSWLLALALARRRRRGRRGRLDAKATLRANARFGGVPFRVVRRARRVGRRDLTVLADVSGSVRRASRLFLRILHRLRNHFAGVRVFAYVDRPVEAGRLLAGRPFEEALAALEGSATLDRFALSDHGEVFRLLARDHPRAVRGRTVLLVLGDGRNNHFPAQEWELEGLSRRVARLFWLVPEELRESSTGDSALARYAPSCTAVFPCPTPAALVQAIARLGRRTGLTRDR